MEKRYQVFISSTFQDLKNARQEVSQALLRADCFPTGMELFPAADEEQFEFIKTIIDQSDYYILISAGRYGSIHPETGLSYTEMEYDYAVKIGKPIIRLLHKDPFNELKGEFIENSDDGREKLTAFRTKLSASKLVRFWEFPKELGIEVLMALLDLKNRKPAVGWVRSDGVLDAKVSIELAELRKKVSDNESQKKSDSIFVTGDEISERIRTAVTDLNRFSAKRRHVYETLLDNIANGDWKYDRMNEGEVELAKRIFPILLAFGSIKIVEGEAGINDRSYADFGFTCL